MGAVYIIYMYLLDFRYIMLGTYSGYWALTIVRAQIEMGGTYCVGAATTISACTW